MKSGYVAIIGKPNTGKSTLLNRILDIHIAAVSHKAQTTRVQVTGIYTDNDSQIIFMDTPGILKANNLLQRKMKEDINRSLDDADIVCLIVDDINYKLDYNFILDTKKDKIILINKIDRLSKSKLKEIEEFLHNKYNDIEIILISALNGDNIDKLIISIKSKLKHEGMFYPEDYISDKPEKFFIVEFLMENIMKIYGQEVPYDTGIIIEEFKERENRKTYIRVNLYVERESQKGIIIGARGSKIKELGVQSRKLIEEFLNREVYLEIHVKVKKHWKDNPLILSRMKNI